MLKHAQSEHIGHNDWCEFFARPLQCRRSDVAYEAAYARSQLQTRACGRTVAADPVAMERWRSLAFQRLAPLLCVCAASTSCAEPPDQPLWEGEIIMHIPRTPQRGTSDLSCL